MKHLLKIFMIAVAMVTAIPSYAVSDKEMEQARVLAAKHYLRYANNGSDYLDNLNPTTMSDLSGSLKTKEKENIKSFNAVAVPKDYASWDKAKLVEYWSSTFFKSPGLMEDGKKCLSVLAKKLQTINVGAPAAPAAAGTPAEKPSEKPSPDATAQTDAAQNDATNAVAEQAVDEAEAAVAQAEADAGLVEERPQEESHTTLYIVILALLVIGVICLVIYASKSMKETGASLSGQKESEKEIRDTKRAAKEELNKMREQYANSLTAKNEEIKQLKAQCQSLEAELEAAKRAAASMRHEQNTPEKHQASESAKQGGLPPVVYLSLVNQKGLFVKASRSLNTESSVYVMEVPDGHHGQFRVVDDSKVLDRILEDVGKWLGGGCIIENPEDADIATEIVTLQPGEAVFSDNTCRVTKKARIKFI